MRTDHVGNMEAAARPAIALGMAVALPVIGVFAPFIVAGLALFGVYLLLHWTWDAAMLPFAGSDVILDDLLLTRFGAGGAIWGAVALVTFAYVVIGGWGWFYREWRLLNPTLLAALLATYAAGTFVAGAVNGTHFTGQVSYAWINPGRSATLAWNCPASVSGGQAETKGRYDIWACRPYVDDATMRGACRQVMRSMAPLTGTQILCSSHIRAMTKHEWPVEGMPYKEWETSFKVPVRHLPEATPARMRTLLAKEGLTPRT